MTMKNDEKFEQELTGQFRIDMKNLTNFDPSTQKSQKICTLIVHFWQKYIMFELKKVQRSYVWLNWRLMQNLKENWIVLSKMTWKISQIFVHRLKNSNFILKNKMAELNKNKNWKQPHQPDVVWKFHFNSKLMNSTINKTFTHVLMLYMFYCS